MADPVVTVEEIKNHSSEEDCWIVVNDVVWDITDFIPSHPGGNESEYIRFRCRAPLIFDSHNQTCRTGRLELIQFNSLSVTHLKDTGIQQKERHNRFINIRGSLETTTNSISATKTRNRCQTALIKSHQQP
jgi:hypothetical protein